MKLKRTVVAPALVAGVALVSGGWLLQSGVSQQQSVFQRARLFDEVMGYVSQRYVEEHPSADLYQKAIEGMLQELGDPHTTFLTPDQYAQLYLQTSGEYAGLGVQIAPQDGWITAVSVLPNTPAERAGLRVGDRFVEIDGESARGWSDDQAVKRLRGAGGTTVTLKVVRVGVDEPIDFRITREEIQVQSVPYAYLLEDGVGYVRLSMFSQTSTQELGAAVERLRAQGARSLVLDLRSNPGGLLDQGVSVADLFLDPGQAIVETRSRDPRETETYRAETAEAFGGLKLAVLVDEYSASAAEIVAGALQDHDRALVVGATTFGKGSVQTLFPLSGGNYLKMTTGRWYTPVGRSIQKDHDTATEGDAQTDAAAAEADTAPRRPYRTDSGRTVFGGGGIVPDVVVVADTSTATEKAFFEAASKSASRFNEVLFQYAVAYERRTPGLARDFRVTPEMRREFWQRLGAAGVEIPWDVFEGGARFIDQRLTEEIAQSKFGQGVAAQLDDRYDTVLQEAARMLRAAPNQAALFRMAEERQQAAQR